MAQIRDEYILLESVQETTSEYTSHKSLTDKIEAVKKSVEKATRVLRKLHRSKYKYVAFQACKTPNRMVKVICGRLKRRWGNVLNEPTELCEQSRGVNVEELQVDVIEVSNDESSNEFLVAPAAKSRAERLIFSVWRLCAWLVGCVLECLLVDRELYFKYCH